MCGIAAILKTANQDLDYDRFVPEMSRMLQHRGPDDDGYYINRERTICLIHRRLSIIDLETGHQPMSASNNRFVIVFNGEIYNYPELKDDLIKKGYVFNTKSDTEVILNLYHDQGYDTPKYLNGIFSFALWDEMKKELFIARDHCGVKPLYYYNGKNFFACASEVKALLKLPDIVADIDPDALDETLTFRYALPPRTIFSNVFKLEPAHYMIIRNAVKQEKKCYWLHRPVIDNKSSEEDLIEQYRKLLSNAVRRQMISDVPVGISLSGGVDSGTILALMSQYASKPVKAFTVGFEGGAQTNEVSEARATAEHFGAEFHEYTVSTKDYEEFFLSYMWHMEEPVGNESAPAYFFVAKLAHQFLKVILNGQGADEPLAGYSRYFGEYYARYYQLVPRMIRQELIYPIIMHHTRSERLKRSVYALNEANINKRFLKIYTITTNEMKKALYNKELIAAIGGHHPSGYIENCRNQVGDLKPLEQMLYVDLRTSLPENLLLSEDKMSMATSVEARVPYLDVPLIEFLENVPLNLKFRLLTRKYIHRKAAQHYLPKRIALRKQRGFTNPMDEWLKTNLSDFVHGLIDDKMSLSARYFNVDYLKNILERHRSDRENYRRFLFLLISLEMWYRCFILKNAA